MKENLVDAIYKELDCKHAISKEFIRTIIKSVSRFDKKQGIYDLQNINEFGEVGLLVEINNRYKKIKKYYEIDEDKREELMLTEESIMKDYIDIAVFAIISYIYKLGKWK
jgi:monomeric isocitrate dehydrogenase